jgi:hypothetical protein
LVADLASLAEAAEDRLALASAEARREWEGFRFRLPSEVELRRGTLALSDDELARMRSKIKRLLSILAAEELARSSDVEIRRIDRHANANHGLDLAESGEQPSVPDNVLGGVLP